jgi:tRNA (guanosine-2'-O-)-methyltransferase
VLSWRQKDLTLALSNIHDPHNVSAIYRSCDAFGVGAVHLYYTDTPFPVLGRKSSASARKWVERIRHTSLDGLMDALRTGGRRILVTSCDAAARPLADWDFTKPTAVIMGNEHRGVDKELAARADGQLTIPMYGMIRSFNVSVAAAVILAEASRQRVLAGMYAQPGYTEEEYAEKLGVWLEK